MFYRAPVAFKVARPFRSGDLVGSVGDLLSAKQVEDKGLGRFVESRHLRAVISPDARRGSSVSATADPESRMTVSEVMRIVGDDPAVAKAYLEAERASAKPRSTLMSSLVATIKAGQGVPA